MKFRFLGASDGHVTGSCTHFFYERKKTQFLVDCGLVQGEGNDEADNARPFPFSPSEIEFVLLTHAHQDHCGLIPKLYRDGFTGRVICTKATGRLAYISLMDAVRHVKGLYTEQDVKRIRFDYLDEREGFGLSRMLPISDDLFASFSRSAHILGAVSIALGWLNEIDEKAYIVMSGDLGNNTKANPYQPLLAGRQGIFGYPEAIVVESTYGGRVREKQFSDFEGRIAALARIVQDEVFDKKTVLIIPAFSLQRTQELLFDLYCVFMKHFSNEEQSQSPFFPPNPWYGDFEDGAWSYPLQSALVQAIASLPSDEQAKWQDAIVKEEELPNKNFRLREGACVSIQDIESLLGERHTYPVDIVLDSTLAREVSAVFRDELCRRQRKNPNETVHRNRMMAERLGLADEEQVDAVVKSLLPASDGESIRIPLGIHSIRYENSFKTPRPIESQGRGCIVITGGGMCEGGPVVTHLGKLLASKRQAAIIATGYMSKGSLGDALLSISKARDEGRPLPTDNLKVGEKAISPEEITARVIVLQGYYSGHADQDGLLDFVFRVVGDETAGLVQKPATVFLNHGQHAARNILKEAIETRRTTPVEGDRMVSSVELAGDQSRWYDLNLKQWTEPEAESKTDRLLRELLTEQRRTNKLLQRLVEQKNVTQGGAFKKGAKPGGK